MLRPALYAGVLPDRPIVRALRLKTGMDVVDGRQMTEPSPDSGRPLTEAPSGRWQLVAVLAEL